MDLFPDDSRQESLQILLVEDDSDLRVTLHEVLRDEGYSVVAVASGGEAIEQASQTRFDLIITDIKTPGTDGLTALEKAKTGNPELDGIVITGYSTEEYALRAAKLKVEDYLKKPFDIDVFLAAVEKLSEKKRHQQAKLQEELGRQRALRWLAVELYCDRKEQERAALEKRLESRKPPFSEGSEVTAALAVQTAALLSIALEQPVSLPDEILAGLPLRVTSLLKAGPELSFAKEFQNYVASIETEIETQSDEEEEDPASLQGSLLNIALLLEGAERTQEAQQAFVDVLNRLDDPSARYLAHFGLARIARQLRDFDGLEKHSALAVAESKKLGPLTLSQALAERGILLALATREDASIALREAVQAAKRVRDTSSFALCSLALEHFNGEEHNRKDRLLAHLAQPEHLSVAIANGGWLMALLLKSPLQGIELKFFSRLVRACPQSLTRLLLATTDDRILTRAVPFISVVGASNLSRVTNHMKAHQSPELQEALRAWKTQKKQEFQSNSTLRVFSFSGMQIFCGETNVDLKRRKPLLLLLFLLSHEGQVGDDKLLETFWPGPEEKARASLRAALSYLRKVLVPDGLFDPFERKSNCLWINPELSIWYDLTEFQRLIRAGNSQKESHPDRALDSYRKAVQLYRGPFLENVYDDWALQIRTNSEQAFENAALSLAAQNLETENWAESQEFASLILRQDPCNQPVYEISMKALMGLGRHHDALNLFDHAKRVLWKELEIEPSIDLIKLRELARLNI